MAHPRAAPLLHERRLWGSGLSLVCGIDEAGRGPLAGPVVAAAVVLAPTKGRPSLAGVTDSKKLTEAERFRAYLAILEAAVEIGVCRVEAWEIDRENILQSTRRAMRGALARLRRPPDHVLVDGNARIDTAIPQTTIVRGDQRSRSVAAASVVAKVTRDAIMRYLHRVAPAYGFDHNKGYGTPAHVEAILRHGPSPFHRRSFLRFYR